jgi:DNA-binding XRE family transcriptional regulator
MARKRYTSEKIIRLLREAEVFIVEGMTAAEAARKIGVSEQT